MAGFRPSADLGQRLALELGMAVDLKAVEFGCYLPRPENCWVLTHFERRWEWTAGCDQHRVAPGFSYHRGAVSFHSDGWPSATDPVYKGAPTPAPASRASVLQLTGCWCSVFIKREICGAVFLRLMKETSLLLGRNKISTFPFIVEEIIVVMTNGHAAWMHLTETTT